MWILIRLIFSSTFPYLTFFSLLSYFHFLVVVFGRLFFFYTPVYSLKVKFFYCLKALTVFLLLYGVPPRSCYLFCTKLFFGLFSPLLYPGGFLFSAKSSWNAFTEWLVAPLSPASSLPLSLISFFKHPGLPYDSP